MAMAAKEIQTCQTVFDEPPASASDKFIWTFEGLTLDRIVKAGPFSRKLKSTPFSALGYNWHVEAILNLRGMLKQVQDSVVYFVLVLDAPSTTVAATWTLSCGTFSQTLDETWRTGPGIDSTAGRKCSIQLTHAMLSANPGDFIIDGVLTLEVTLTAKQPQEQESRTTAGAVRQVVTVPVAPPSLVADVRRVLDGAVRGCPSDVQLLCADGQRVPAHSYILSMRSSVFSALFAPESGLAPVDREACPVPPEINSATLRRTLQFIYTDELTPTSTEEAQHLLNAADVYQLPRLKSICERTLCELLSVESVCFTLTLASQHRALALEREATLFAARNAVAVLRTEGWAHLSAQAPELKDRIIFAIATGGAAAPEVVVPDAAAAAAAAGAGAGAGAASGSGSKKRARVNR